MEIISKVDGNRKKMRWKLDGNWMETIRKMDGNN